MMTISETATMRCSIQLLKRLEVVMEKQFLSSVLLELVEQENQVFDELMLRIQRDNPELKVALLCVDPTEREPEEHS